MRLAIFCISLMLTACASEPKLTTEIRTETVNVPVPVCPDKDALPKPRFVVNGAVNQDAAAAAIELREWRKFGAVLAAQCNIDK